MNTPLDSRGTTPARLSPAASRRLEHQLTRAIHELGAVHTVPDESGQSTVDWSIDPEPRIVEADEWQTIEAAVVQRARLINCVLADLYGRQEILRQQLLPPELVLGDPFFRRQCVNLDTGRHSPATLLQFDLVCVANGGWMFADTHANTPVGAGFAVQTRRLMLQKRGDFYAAIPEFRRIINFPLLLLDHLRNLSPRDAEHPNIVILTAGPRDPAYLEHSLLARKMGLPLAQGGDLLVLDEQVFFKSVSGLTPIDVIYRRVNDSLMDPVAFPTDSLAGVPGLTAAIRARKVAVANALGTGIADSRALEAYLPHLLRFFLGQRPILPGVPTYYCGDMDQFALVADNPDGAFTFVPAQRSNTELAKRLRTAARHGREPLVRAIKKHPHAVVAQADPMPKRSLRSGAQSRDDLRISCYALCEDRAIHVMAGALLRTQPTDRKPGPPVWQVGRVRDLIVLVDEDGGDAETPVEQPERVRPLMLGSRSADNLFWAGRYAERAEGAARVLSIIGDVGLEEISRRDRRAWFPVWQGLLEATGHSGMVQTSGQQWFTASLARHMTLDPANPSALISNVRAAQWNASQSRNVFSPESWRFLARLSEQLESLGKKKRIAGQRLAQKAIEGVLDHLSAFFGTIDRTMLHDTAWHFFHAGVLLERAIMTSLCLRHGITEAEKAATDNRHEEADLSALIRMLSSQDAYRRTYQARAEPLFVAELFLLNASAPKSIRACALELRDHLAAISSLTGKDDDQPLQETRDLLHQLETLNIEAFFPQRTDSPRIELRGSGRPEDRKPRGAAPRSRGKAPESLEAWLTHLHERLESLATLLHDFYFSHHAHIAPESGANGTAADPSA